jgi:uncharacterized protein YeaO (DUF488 family)
MTGSSRIKAKRIYAEATPADGTRVLVDRLWPRGVSKERAALDAWLRNLAPSDTLRQWLHAHPQAWLSFRKRYLKELGEVLAAQAIEELHRLADQPGRLTLLFASVDQEHNHAVVLKELLEGMRKPPTGTGPGAISAMRNRRAQRMPRP